MFKKKTIIPVNTLTSIASSNRELKFVVEADVLFCF